MDISSTTEQPSPVLDPKSKRVNKMEKERQQAESYKPKNINERRAAFQNGYNDTNNPLIVDSSHPATYKPSSNNEFPTRANASDIKKAINEPPPPITLDALSHQRQPTTIRENTQLTITYSNSGTKPRSKPFNPSSISNTPKVDDSRFSVSFASNLKPSSRSTEHADANIGAYRPSQPKSKNEPQQQQQPSTTQFKLPQPSSNPTKPQQPLRQHQQSRSQPQQYPQKPQQQQPQAQQQQQQPRPQQQQQSQQQFNKPPLLNLDIVESKTPVIISPSGREIKSILSKTKKTNPKKVQFSNFVDVGVAASPPTTNSHESVVPPPPPVPQLPPKATNNKNNQPNVVASNNDTDTKNRQQPTDNAMERNINSIVDQMNSSTDQFPANYTNSKSSNTIATNIPQPSMNSRNETSSGQRREALVQAKQKFHVSSTELSNKIQTNNNRYGGLTTTPSSSNDNTNRSQGLSWFSDRPNSEDSIDSKSNQGNNKKQQNSIPAY